MSEQLAADLTDRFWLILREPGMVPDRKGPWKHAHTAKILREFMVARPTAFIDVLTIGHDGTPDVQHGPEALQMADGRSMSVGRKHNERTRAAAVAALTAPTRDGEVERLREALAPFAACADELDGSEDVPRAPDGEWAKFRLLTDDYRRARAALAARSGEG